MKLQKRLSRKYQNKEYFKWMITLPEEIIKSTDFKEGDELEVSVKDQSIVLSKKKV